MIGTGDEGFIEVAIKSLKRFILCPNAFAVFDAITRTEPAGHEIFI